MKHEFNPYDLNDIADIDKFMEQWEQEKLRKLTHTPTPPPTKGILRRDDPRREDLKIQTKLQS